MRKSPWICMLFRNKIPPSLLKMSQISKCVIIFMWYANAPTIADTCNSILLCASYWQRIFVIKMLCVGIPLLLYFLFECFFSFHVGKIYTNKTILRLFLPFKRSRRKRSLVSKKTKIFRQYTWLMVCQPLACFLSDKSWASEIGSMNNNWTDALYVLFRFVQFCNEPCALSSIPIASIASSLHVLSIWCWRWKITEELNHLA